MRLQFLNTITAMSIEGESENIPSWVANWPHCCDFGGDTCDGLRYAAMVLEASRSQQNAPFNRIMWPGLNICILFRLPQLSRHRGLFGARSNMIRNMYFLYVFAFLPNLCFR